MSTEKMKKKCAKRYVAFTPEVVRKFEELLAEIAAVYPKRPALVRRGREVLTRAKRDSDAADKACAAATKSVMALEAYMDYVLALQKKGYKPKTAGRR